MALLPVEQAMLERILVAAVNMEMDEPVVRWSNTISATCR